MNTQRASSQWIAKGNALLRHNAGLTEIEIEKEKEF